MGVCDIAIDSGAGESVRPKGCLNEEPTVGLSSGPMRFVAAHGQETGLYGSTALRVRRRRCANVMSMGFKVTDVAPRREAIRRIVERSNIAQFDGGGWWWWIRNESMSSQIP